MLGVEILGRLPDFFKNDFSKQYQEIYLYTILLNSGIVSENSKATVAGFHQINSPLASEVKN